MLALLAATAELPLKAAFNQPLLLLRLADLHRVVLLGGIDRVCILPALAVPVGDAGDLGAVAAVGIFARDLRHLFH
jgi:hypothetical protein